jgi:hypothetical protein
MYLERRINASIHGPAHFDFSAVIGWKHLGKFALNRNNFNDAMHC